MFDGSVVFLKERFASPTFDLSSESTGYTVYSPARTPANVPLSLAFWVTAAHDTARNNTRITGINLYIAV